MRGTTVEIHVSLYLHLFMVSQATNACKNEVIFNHQEFLKNIVLVLMKMDGAAF